MSWVPKHHQNDKSHAYANFLYKSIYVHNLRKSGIIIYIFCITNHEHNILRIIRVSKWVRKYTWAWGGDGDDLDDKHLRN